MDDKTVNVIACKLKGHRVIIGDDKVVRCSTCAFLLWSEYLKKCKYVRIPNENKIKTYTTSS